MPQESAIWSIQCVKCAEVGLPALGAEEVMDINTKFGTEQSHNSSIQYMRIISKLNSFGWGDVSMPKALDVTIAQQWCS